VVGEFKRQERNTSAVSVFGDKLQSDFLQLHLKDPFSGKPKFRETEFLELSLGHLGQISNLSLSTWE